MKKLFVAALVAFTMSVSSYAFFINCAPGNTAYSAQMLDGTVQQACCVPVGDGSVLSCTSDNQNWFNARFTSESIN